MEMSPFVYEERIEAKSAVLEGILSLKSAMALWFWITCIWENVEVWCIYQLANLKLYSLNERMNRLSTTGRRKSSVIDKSPWLMSINVDIIVISKSSSGIYKSPSLMSCTTKL